MRAHDGGVCFAYNLEFGEVHAYWLLPQPSVPDWMLFVAPLLAIINCTAQSLGLQRLQGKSPDFSI
jgi:hypothetical protein